MEEPLIICNFTISNKRCMSTDKLQIATYLSVWESIQYNSLTGGRDLTCILILCSYIAMSFSYIIIHDAVASYLLYQLKRYSVFTS